jgi:hypothetical protein
MRRRARLGAAGPRLSEGEQDETRIVLAAFS